MEQTGDVYQNIHFTLEVLPSGPIDSPEVIAAIGARIKEVVGLIPKCEVGYDPYSGVARSNTPLGAQNGYGMLHIYHDSDGIRRMTSYLYGITTDQNNPYMEVTTHYHLVHKIPVNVQDALTMHVTPGRTFIQYRGASFSGRGHWEPYYRTMTDTDLRTALVKKAGRSCLNYMPQWEGQLRQRGVA